MELNYKPIVVLVLLGVLSAHSVPARENALKLTMLGSVDGKSYYADNTTARDWPNAGAYCQSNGLALASIRNSAQWVFLQTVSDSKTIRGYYWTDGRDSLDVITQFRWNRTNSAQESFTGRRWAVGALEARTCVAYSAEEIDGYGSIFVPRACNFLAPGVLCETY